MIRRKRFVSVAILAMMTILVAGCGKDKASTPVAENAPVVPFITASSPLNGSTVSRDISVLLHFNCEMDSGTLLKSATFEPPLEFKLKVEGTQTEFQPVTFLDSATTYRFVLKAGPAKSIDGVSPEEEFSLVFTAQDDRISLSVPLLNFQGQVIEGSDPTTITDSLGYGAGHYPGTGRPGGGNFVLLAHCSGQVDFPFNHLMNLNPDDELILIYQDREWIYQMVKGLTVHESELWILEPSEDPIITFFVCSTAEGKPSPTFHPAYRYVIRSKLVDTCRL